MKMVSAAFNTARVVPDESECQNCKQQAVKRWETNRSAIDCCPDACSLLQVVVGVYYCNYCDLFFRNQPGFLRPNSIYTNKVVNVAIASVVEDGMPITRVPNRLRRDFGIQPSETTIRNWLGTACAGLPETDFAEYSQIGDSFSGVLCIDEGYSGSLSMLLATDPNDGDRIIAFVIKEKNFDTSDVKKFLGKLKSQGIEPSQVVTDESMLYPKVVKETWPNVGHQLCLFHINAKLCKAAKKAVQKLKNDLPKKPRAERSWKREDKKSQVIETFRLEALGCGLRKIAREVGVSRNSVKKWLSEPESVCRRYSISEEDLLKPEKQKIRMEEEISKGTLPAGWESWEQVEAVKKQLSRLAYRISYREESDEDHWGNSFEEAINSPVGPDLLEVRSFIDNWYEIWWENYKPRQNGPQAKKIWDDLAHASLPDCCQSFETFHRRMTDDKFMSLSTYFSGDNFQRTNNSAERAVRRMKKVQKVRYSARTKSGLRNLFSIAEALRLRPLENGDLTKADLIHGRLSSVYNVN